MGALEEVVILVGGKGTRLKPLTKIVPKPMVEINGKPFLEYKIKQIKDFGAKKIILCVGYLGNIIQDYFGNERKFGVDISYSHEEELLGTAGAIKKAENLIEGNSFIVMNGDTHSYINLNELSLFHKQHNFPMTMVVTEAKNSKEQELVELQNSVIVNFYQRNTPEHKEFLEKNTNPLVNAGVYIFDRKILGLIPLEKKTSLEQEIFPKLINNSAGFKYHGYLKDIANSNLLQ